MMWSKCSQNWKVKVAPEIVNKDLFRGNASRIAGNARVPFTFTRRTRFLDLSKNHKRYCYRQVEQRAEVISLRQEMQTRLATNSNEMNYTRFTWKTLFSGKNHGNRIFHYEKGQNTNGVIEPDLVQTCAETTISTQHIKPQHVDIYPPLKLPKLLCCPL